MKRKLLGLFTALCLLATSAFSTYAADELFDVTFEDIGDNQPAYATSPGGQQEDGFTGLLTALAIVSENEAASGALLGGAAFGEFAAITSRMAGRTGLGEDRPMNMKLRRPPPGSLATPTPALPPQTTLAITRR